jgi:hypothetical protein
VNVLGLAFILAFLFLMVLFTLLRRRWPFSLREIEPFRQLKRAIGLAVEAGTRVHFSLGRGGFTGVDSAASYAGLSMLSRIARVTSLGDRPAMATAGEGALAVLERDVLKAAHRDGGIEHLYDPSLGQISGLTPFSYAAGAMAITRQPEISVNVFAGHFGSEVALLTEAAGRDENICLAGSDDLIAQAVMYATASSPLVGEELFAGGAYLGVGRMHLASLQTEDIFRWGLVAVILIGAFLKLLGVL